MGVDRYQLGDVYQTHRIKELYDVDFPQFFADLGELLKKAQKEHKKLNLDNLVLQLTGTYKARIMPKS